MNFNEDITSSNHELRGKIDLDNDEVEPLSSSNFNSETKDKQK